MMSCVCQCHSVIRSRVIKPHFCRSRDRPTFSRADVRCFRCCFLWGPFTTVRYTDFRQNTNKHLLCNDAFRTGNMSIKIYCISILYAQCVCVCLGSEVTVEPTEGYENGMWISFFWRFFRSLTSQHTRVFFYQVILLMKHLRSSLQVRNVTFILGLSND